MASRVARLRIIVTLLVIFGYCAILPRAQTSRPHFLQTAGEWTQKTDDWPGQARAYTAFAEMLSADNIGAGQHPEQGQRYRFDFHAVLGLTQDEVGSLWSILLEANQKCSELDSQFVSQYPDIPPIQALEAGNGSLGTSSAEMADAAAKRRQEFADLSEKKSLVTQNGIDELKLQLGSQDFHVLDNWVRVHFAPAQHAQHHPARYR